MSRSRIEGIKREMYRKGILDSAESVPLGKFYVSKTDKNYV